MDNHAANSGLTGHEDREIASFYVGDALMGIPIDQVEEINHHLDLTPVPHAPAIVRGVVNLRGEVVTVIDLRVVLGMEPAVVTGQTCNIVVRWRGERIGFVVDRIGDVVRTRLADISRPPANVSGVGEKCFSGVYKLERTLLALLDVEHILAMEATQHA